MLKFMGCVFIFISCCSLGALKASSYSTRTAELESILEIIKLLDLEITYKKEPLAKTFQKVSNLKTCWFSKVLESCSKMLTAQRPLHDAWQDALHLHREASPLDRQDLEILQDLALGLGKSDTKSQRRLLEPAQVRIKARLEQAKELERKQGRMYKALGVSAGVVLVIMII